MARNKYPEATRALIVETAAKLFMEKGYEHTSIQDIIDNLGGLSKGAIYYHFKSKEEIMNAVAEWLYADSGKEIEKVCARTDLNGQEKLRELFRVSLSSGAQESLFAVCPDMMKNPQLLMLYLRDSVQTEAPDILEPIFEQGIADGSIQTEYPRELAEVLMLLGNFWLNPMVYHSDSEGLLRKMKFFRELCARFGLDIIDDGAFGLLEKYGKVYEENHGR